MNSMLATFVLLYTDPGTGAMLWQLLAAAFIGGAFYFRHYFSKIKVLLSTVRNRK
ncbi:MAG TPA: hypothetical protein VFD48_01090 [Pyrinomonadaceae bacterium]|jgi:hypothetical protein|nr:hypothetical protein [Pyrinomonadaceae bacterium]